jgi:DegV family protein with EDD domain
MYEAEHPGRRVFVIDSLSAGPELTLMVYKLRELIEAGNTYEEICDYMDSYTKKTGLLFMLESLNNFAANGRVSPAVAKIAGVLGIRIVGKASNKGTLEPTDKCRGEGKSLSAILKHLKEDGLQTGKVHIAHCRGEAASQKMKAMIEAEVKKLDRVDPNKAFNVLDKKIVDEPEEEEDDQPEVVEDGL